MLAPPGGAGEEGAARAALSPGEAMRAALLANTNLGGDCCNRGMMLGAVLGAVVGRAGIPADLIDGLARREELLADFQRFSALCASAAAAAAAAAAEGMHAPSGRLGRPWPSPLLSSPSGALGGLALPVDFAGKLALLQRLAAAGGRPLHQLRFFRHLYPRAGWGAGAAQQLGSKGAPSCFALAPGLQLAPTLRLSPLHLLDGAVGVAAAAAAAAGARCLGLEEGVAVRDRREALEEQSGSTGGRGSGSSSSSSASSSSSSSSGAGGVASSALDASPFTYPSLAQLQACAAGSDDAVCSSWWAQEGSSSSSSSSAVQPGVGVFYYPHPLEMAVTLAACQADRGRAPQRLQQLWGVAMVTRGGAGEEK